MRKRHSGPGAGIFVVIALSMRSYLISALHAGARRIDDADIVSAAA